MKARFLFAHMSFEEVLAASTNPKTEGVDADALKRWWDAARSSIEKRASAWQKPTTASLPGGSEDYLASLRAQPLASQIGSDNWDVRLVDLRGVISIQKSLMEDRIKVPPELQTGSADPGRLLRFCLAEPSKRSVAVQTGPGNSFVLSTPDVNLRVTGLINAESPQGNVYGFLANHGLPWMQVVEWQGRQIMRDGYHRAVGLLRHGHTVVPVAYIPNVRQELIGLRAGFFDVETVAGPTPPLLTDFLDDHLSMVIEVPHLHRAIRITAEEFLIPTD